MCLSCSVGVWLSCSAGVWWSCRCVFELCLVSSGMGLSCPVLVCDISLRISAQLEPQGSPDRLRLSRTSPKQTLTCPITTLMSMNTRLHWLTSMQREAPISSPIHTGDTPGTIMRAVECDQITAQTLGHSVCYHCWG